VSQNLCHKFLLVIPHPLLSKNFPSTWVQKWTGSEISTYVHVRVSFGYYIRCSNECGNEFVSFPQTLLYARNCSTTWNSTIRKCFLIQKPCLMCIAITHYSLDTSYCIPFHTLSITHSSVFLVDHSISRIYTQQWISRNLFTFGPMLIGRFCLIRGGE